MTISQTLRRIAKLKNELKENLERAVAGLNYADDSRPAYTFADSMTKADAARLELVRLETALRVTNASTLITIEGGNLTLAEATCRLAEHKGRIAWLRALPSQPQPQRNHNAMGWNQAAQQQVLVTVVHYCDLPEVKRQEAVAREQALFDALNDAVETTNHRTQLMGNSAK